MSMSDERDSAFWTWQWTSSWRTTVEGIVLIQDGSYCHGNDSKGYCTEAVQYRLQITKDVIQHHCSDDIVSLLDPVEMFRGVKEVGNCRP